MCVCDCVSVHVCVFVMHMCMPTMSRREHCISRAGAIDGREPPDVSDLDLKLDPLQEQNMLLTVRHHFSHYSSILNEVFTWEELRGNGFT